MARRPARRSGVRNRDARAQGAGLRPHAKTHKSAHVARLQAAAGAVGVCVQKLGEVEALADAGVDDIYISNQVVDASKPIEPIAHAPRFEQALFVKSQVISRGLPAIGDAVWLVPGRCDPTVNLHDGYVAVRGGLAAGVVEGLWPVHARGRVR